MKKFSLIILFLSVLSCPAFAQSILGKWSQRQNLPDIGMDMELDMEFLDKNKVILSVLGTASNDGMVTIVVSGTITGKYEYAGKALCILFNNDAKSSSRVQFSDFVDQQLRNQINAKLAPALPVIEDRIIKMITRYSSAGLYSQILQVNATDLVLKYPGIEAECFKRQ